MKNRILILLIIWFYSIPLYAQDTVTIFFNTGISKIEDNQLEKLNSIPSKFELSDLDSIHYVGMADSVGEVQSNFRLSQKRAKNVANYCKNLFQKNIQFKIIAKGESLKNNQNNEDKRRVDILLFFKSKASENNKLINLAEAYDTVLTDTFATCFNVDYSLLHRSHLRVITKGSKKYVLIETQVEDLAKNKSYFFATENEKGELIIQPVKWKNKKTGNFWWGQKRSTASIPKDDFERYKLFQRSVPPCNGCNEVLTKKGRLVKEDTCIQADRFLMVNIQFKKPLFSRNIQIRAPREFVNPDYTYYYGCSLDKKIIWETKKGKRKQNYYYTKFGSVLISGRYFMYPIVRVMDCCKSNPEPSECDRYVSCAGGIGGGRGQFALYSEAGYIYQQDKHLPYIGIGLGKMGLYNQLMWWTGTDIDLSLYSSVRFQQGLFSFPFSALNPATAWLRPGEEKISGRYGSVYVGTEIKTRLYKTKIDYLQHNIHFGLASVNLNSHAIIPRIFIQGGFALNYLDMRWPVIYPFVQIGLNIKLLRL